MRTLLLTLLLSFVASAADLAGTWDVEVMADSETHAAKLKFIAIEDKWAGTIVARGQEYPMKDVKSEGDSVTFQVDANERTVMFRLKVTESGLEGRWETDGNSGPVKGKKAA